MSARETLRQEMTRNHLYMTDERADELINAFAHELAEQQRMWALDYVGDGDNSSYDYTYAVTLGAKLAADLIDPGAGLVRPDGEPTP